MITPKTRARFFLSSTETRALRFCGIRSPISGFVRKNDLVPKKPRTLCFEWCAQKMLVNNQWWRKGYCGAPEHSNRKNSIAQDELDYVDTLERSGRKQFYIG